MLSLDDLLKSNALRWRILPTKILCGQLAIRWKLIDNENTLQGELHILSTEAATIRDVCGKFSIALLNKIHTKFHTKAEGYLLANLTTITLHQYRAPVFCGNVTWLNAIIGSDGGIPLGDILINLAPSKDGATHGLICNRDSPLEISGTVLLESSGTYTINLRARQRHSCLADSLDALMKRSSPDSDGYYTISHSGQIPMPSPSDTDHLKDALNK